VKPRTGEDFRESIADSTSFVVYLVVARSMNTRVIIIRKSVMVTILDGVQFFLGGVES